MAHVDCVVVFLAADDRVDDWALALPIATTRERIAKPDVSRDLCLSIMGISSQSTPLVIKTSSICHLFVKGN